jgi:ATP-dependent Lhr-like helicase
VLVTTPESLSLLLARADAKEVLGSVRWSSSMNGMNCWATSAGCRCSWRWPGCGAGTRLLCVWGMSATLGNLQEAMHTLLGRGGGTLVQGQVPKKLIIDSLLPSRAERFPWGGHLGLTMLPQVIEEIAGSSTTLVFTNTRSQSEIWYQALLEANRSGPD